MRRLLLLLSTLAWFALPATAQDLYVDQYAAGCASPMDTDYDEATRSCGSGSSVVYDNICDGIGAVGAAETLEIRGDGTAADDVYVESCRLLNGVDDMPTGGTDANTHTVIQGESGENVIMRPSGGAWVIYLRQPDSFITLQNFTLDGINITGTSDSYAFKHFRQDGQFTDDWHLIDMTVVNASGHLVQIFNHTNWLISGGTYKDPGLEGHVQKCNMFYISLGDGMVIEDITAETTQLTSGQSASCGAIRMSPNTGESITNGIIQRVKLISSGTALDRGIGIFIGGGGSSTYNMVRNVTCQNKNRCVNTNSAGDGSTGLKILNNTFFSSSVGVYVNSSAEVSTEIRNNAFEDNTTDITDNGTSTITQTNYLSSAGDPLFTNEGTFDFSLQSNSPLIGAGTTLALVTDDHIETARPQGANYDIGAYEKEAPTAVLNAPNGGEVWEIGTTQSITFECTGFTNAVIDLSGDSGSMFDTEIDASVACASGSPYSLDTTGLMAGTTYRFRICDATDDDPCDASDADFELASESAGTITVSAPATGDYFLGGHEKPIAWTSENISGNVRIDFSCNDGATWEVGLVSASFPFDSPSFSWTVPNRTCVGTAQIRVVSLNDTSILDASDSFSTSSATTGFSQ